MLDYRSFLTINDFEFNFVTEFQVTSSWEDLTDQATITIPQAITYRRGGKVLNITQGDDSAFQRGNTANINHGYSRTNLVFDGFITKISPNRPLMFDLQDGMYLLKQKTIQSYSKKKVTLKSLLLDIVGDDFVIQSADIELGFFRITKANVAEVLQHLKSEYGITSYIRDNVLISGLAYLTENPNELTIHDLSYGVNIIEDDDLSYIRGDDQKIKINAISIYPDNTRVEASAGDENGDQRTMYFYDVPESELKRVADEELAKIKVEGFQGSFTTFAQPVIRFGDAVRIKNNDVPEKDGVYLVKRVVTSGGVNGGLQRIYLDRRI